NRLHGSDKFPMIPVNIGAPLGEVAIRRVPETRIAVEFKMVVRIDQAREGDSVAQIKRGGCTQMRIEGLRRPNPEFLAQPLCAGNSEWMVRHRIVTRTMPEFPQFASIMPVSKRGNT